MKRFILCLTLLLSAVLFHGVDSTSAASLTQADMAAIVTAGDGDFTKVQGYGGGGGGGGGGYDDGYRRRNYDGDGYRGRRHGDDYRRGYCSKCAYHCDNGYCPRRCYGWRSSCGRNRSY